MSICGDADWVGCLVQALLLERVAPVAEILRAVRDELLFPGINLPAVLSLLQVAELGREAVDAAVEAPDLGVELVDEPPQQALALLGEMGADRADALGEDAERLTRPTILSIRTALLPHATNRPDAIVYGSPLCSAAPEVGDVGGRDDHRRPERIAIAALR